MNVEAAEAEKPRFAGAIAADAASCLFLFEPLAPAVAWISDADSADALTRPFELMSQLSVKPDGGVAVVWSLIPATIISAQSLTVVVTEPAVTLVPVPPGAAASDDPRGGVDVLPVGDPAAFPSASVENRGRGR